MDKKLFTALAFAYKTLDYEKDPNPDNWITIKGTHTHLEGGKINGGAGGKFNGKGYTGTKKQAHVGKSTEEKQAGNGEYFDYFKELKRKRDLGIITPKQYEEREKQIRELAKKAIEITKTEESPENKPDKNWVRAKLGREKYDKLMENLSGNQTYADKLKASMGEKAFNEAMAKSLENARNLPQEEKKEPETKTESKQGTTKSLSGASMEKVTQAFYKAYQNEKDEKVKQELKMWHDVAKDDPDGEYKGDTVKFLRDVIEGLNWDKGVNKYNPKEKDITDKKRKALLKIINGLKETGSKANAKKEEWRKNNRQLKLFDRKPKR